MTKTEGKKIARQGLPMSESEIEDWRKAFADIEESIANVMATGVDIGTEERKTAGR